MNTIKTLIISFASLFAAQVFAGPVNINSADVTALDQELVGVGPVIAQRIVEHREAHGAFQSPEELMLVKGVGEKVLAKNAEFILLK